MIEIGSGEREDEVHHTFKTVGLDKLHDVIVVVTLSAFQVFSLKVLNKA